jgi:hypothetical protein
MKRSLLESLRGLPKLEAQAIAEKAGLRVQIIDADTPAITTIARGDTVILEINDAGIVSGVDAGDPLQIED